MMNQIQKITSKLTGKSERVDGDRVHVGASTRYADVETNDSGEGKKLLLDASSNDDDETNQMLAKRWVALGLFGALAFSQCCIWNTWSPMATSVMIAFPTWQKSSLALLSNWGCITYLTCCLPCCWFLKEIDLSIPLKVAASLSTIATFLRCISSHEMIFTTTAHIAAILNGLSGVIIGPATALVSAVWFPTGERTTATGISSACSQLGMAMSYLLAPAFVENPSNHTETKMNHSSIRITPSSLINITIPDRNNSLTLDQLQLRVQIMLLMRIEFVVQFLLLVAVLWFYPQHSKKLPSNLRTSAVCFSKSLIKLISNKTMWWLCLAAAFCQGSTGPWLATITMAFGSTITQEEADKLAFWTVIFSSTLSLFASRIMDKFQGHLKISIFILIMASSMMFLWIVLLDWRIVTFHKDELYAAVIFGIATSWSTPALFLELASEIAFPISEAIVGGFMIFISNIIGTTFYLSYIIPVMGGRWSTCLALCNLILGTILIANVKDEYNRTTRDSHINLS